MQKSGKYILPFLTAAVVLSADQAVKRWAAGALRGTAIPVVHGFFDLELVLNRGAAFGILQGQRLPLILVSFVLMAVLFFYRERLRSAPACVRFGIGLLLGGTAGNLLDRIFRGYVVDMLSFHWKNAYSFPTFNIADAGICCGIFLCVAYSLIRRHESAQGDEHDS